MTFAGAAIYANTDVDYRDRADPLDALEAPTRGAAVARRQRAATRP